MHGGAWDGVGFAQLLRIHGAYDIQTFSVLRDAGSFFKTSLHPMDSCRDYGGGAFHRQAVIDPAALFLGIQQAGLVENGDVLGNCGWSKLEQVYYLADAQLSALEGHDNAHPIIVRHGLGDGHEVAHQTMFVRHITKYSKDEAVRSSCQPFPAAKDGS